MRRLLLASCIALAPGLALAQTSGAVPPPPSGPEMVGGPGGPGTWGGKAWHHDVDPGVFLMKFYAANTTHDGHLTLAQAKAGGLTEVADHFPQIDIAKRGYVTYYDIVAWRLDSWAKHLQERANQLRAQDK